MSILAASEPLFPTQPSLNKRYMKDKQTSVMLNVNVIFEMTSTEHFKLCQDEFDE